MVINSLFCIFDTGPFSAVNNMQKEKIRGAGPIRYRRNSYLLKIRSRSTTACKAIGSNLCFTCRTDLDKDLVAIYVPAGWPAAVCVCVVPRLVIVRAWQQRRRTECDIFVFGCDIFACLI